MKTTEAKDFILIKMGKKDFMEKLIYRGEVYMNSVFFYKNHQNDEIGDIFEGVELVRDGKIIKYREGIENEMLFCVWHINDQGTNSVGTTEMIDDKNITLTIDFREYKNFGDYMVIISNVQEFNNRLNNALNEKGYTCHHEIVTYYDETTTTRNITAYNKRMKYAHQNEKRYLVKTKDTDFLKLNLGSLTDIATIFPIESQAKFHIWLKNIK